MPMDLIFQHQTNTLKNRKQRAKIDSTYSSWEEILFRGYH